MPRVGITRSLPQLVDLIPLGHARGIEIVPLPIMTIRHVPFEWPSAVNGTGPDWLVFTSQHGVEAFFRRLTQLGRAIPNTTRIAAVGIRTAAALGQFGRTADLIPDEAYGDQLFDLLLERYVAPHQRVMYARGEEVNCDPATLFTGRGIPYFPIVCYAAEAGAISPNLPGSFGAGDYILFTAPSAVRAWHAQFGVPACQRLAIGRTTAQAMEGLGWSNVRILPTPDVGSILESIPWKE
jgi:uroporphyrinogen-III synthase